MKGRVYRLQPATATCGTAMREHEHDGISMVRLCCGGPVVRAFEIAPHMLRLHNIQS